MKRSYVIIIVMVDGPLAITRPGTAACCSVSFIPGPQGVASGDGMSTEVWQADREALTCVGLPIHCLL